MPPPQAKPIRSGYHCDVIKTLGDPSNVMNDLGVVDGENETNTDDKVESHNAINWLSLEYNVSHVL